MMDASQHLSPMNMSQFADSVSSGDEAPPMLRKKIGGRQPGATNYSVEEVQCLLDLIRRMKPTNAAQWDQLSVEYNKIQTFNPRTGDNLNKKFQSLLKKKKSTDGSELAPEVALARSIHLQIRSANLSGADFGVDAADFSVDVDSHSQPSNVALLVPDATTALQAAVVNGANQINQMRPRQSGSNVSSSSATSSMRNIGNNMAEVTALLNQLLEQNRNTVDSHTIINLLESISADVKLVLAELVQLNTLQNPNNALGSRRTREQDIDEARNKQARHQ